MQEELYVAKLFENFENVSVKKCTRKGVLPVWIEGTLLRNGPGMFKIGNTEYKHLFDGLAYICRYHFRDGELYYSAKFLESENYLANMKAERIVRSEFGTFRYPDPCKNIFKRFFSSFQAEKSDNCLVSFTQIGDGVYALTETPTMLRIDIDTLENLGEVDLTKYLTLHTYTAHNNCDEDGNVYNVGITYGKNSKYVFAKTLNPLKKPEASSSHSAEFTELIGTMTPTQPSAPTYFHSFGMSKNYFVLFESPIRKSTMKLMSRNITGASFRDAMEWKDDLGTNVFVMNRHTGEPLPFKVKSNPFFTFHHANSFEKDGFLVVDYCYMRNPGTFESLELRALRTDSKERFGTTEDTKAFLHRMIIPLAIPENAKPGDDLLEHCTFARSCHAYLKEGGIIFAEDMRLCNYALEFPRYNFEKFNMKEYKYVYGSDALSFNENENIGVIKADVTATGDHKVWRKKKSSEVCGEPVFVPHPDMNDEDDGVLLVPVMTTKQGDNPYIVVLNAKDMSEITHFTIPEERIPFGFHGMYFGPRVANP